jgi:hypothetical protein
MWLPTPLYEALPYLYSLVGLTFISGTLYIGLQHPNAVLYIVCGLVSIISGIIVFGKRQFYRRNSPDSVQSGSTGTS